MQGSRGRDFTQAFKESGINRKDAKGYYIWHHFDDFDPETGSTTMQLVQRSAHEETYPHSGSASQFSKEFGVKYDTPEAVFVSEEKGWLKGRTPKKSCG